ncbi:hypothetical protein [Micromonospora sp. NPDC049497]|uniref:hypothetical protein n=1 Tax=Micromonospora sp. NPDC049497 TaxID=3364273 RepID=UPI0037B0CF38
MRGSEPDIMAVRDLPPGRPEPTDESVTRTWHTITRRSAVRRSRFRRWLVPAAAAGLVAVLAVGAAVLLAPTRQETPPAPLTARQVMDQLIEKAAGIEPVAVPAGQILYVRTALTGGEDPGPRTSETWFDGQTIMPLRIRVDGADTSIDGPDNPGSVAEDNRNIVAAGGNWYFPTPRWLADVPTDPAALRARLDEETFGSLTRREETGRPIAFLAQLLSRSEPRLSPELRVGFYRLIAELDGLAVTESTIGGVRIWAVGQPDEYGRGSNLLFDAETGHVVGDRFVGWGDRGTPPTSSPVSYDPERDLQRVWTFAVVPDTSRTE